MATTFARRGSWASAASRWEPSFGLRQLLIVEVRDLDLARSLAHPTTSSRGPVLSNGSGGGLDSADGRRGRDHGWLLQNARSSTTAESEV